MKAYSTQNIRNVVLLGSTKSGKTTLSEAMLYEGKVIDRRGSVEAKNTVSDNAEIEQMNQRSIYATPLYAEFMDTKFNIIASNSENSDRVRNSNGKFKRIRAQGECLGIRSR